MAIKVAFVKENGEINHILTPSDDNDFVDGQSYEELVARHLDYTENEIDFINLKVWSSLGWADRSAKPGSFYDWSSEGWIFNIENFYATVRRQRNNFLKSCDWTQMPDSALSTEQKTAWATYRQALRDFPATVTTERTLEELIWPTSP